MQNSRLIFLLGMSIALLASTALSQDRRNIYRRLEDNDSEGISSDGSRFVRPTIKCVSGSDCGHNECSVMGMQRYSEPRCGIRGQLGAPCRPDQEAANKTLHFPHANMECAEVYLQFCPCARGFACIEAECKPIATVATSAASVGAGGNSSNLRSPLEWRAKQLNQRRQHQLQQQRQLLEQRSRSHRQLRDFAGPASATRANNSY